MKEVIRAALTASPDPLTIFEICRGTDHQPQLVRRELLAMEQAGEVERVCPDPDRFWALTSDASLRAALDEHERGTA